jgi:peptidoglycan/xylan/chitin deacetylase (PgdA/CDA1 family)
VLGLDRALGALQGNAPLGRDAVVVTIDDGYRETYEVAFPILQRLACPATVYLPTALIGRDQPIVDDALLVLIRDAVRTPGLLREGLEEAGIALPSEPADRWRPDNVLSLARILLNRVPHADLERLRDALARRLPGSRTTLASLRLLTWPMVQKMHRSGVIIGSHSRTHQRLPVQPPEVAWNEIAGSKAELEAQLQAPVLHFAYPDGRSSASVENAVRRAGYRSAVGTDEVPNLVGHNPYALGRRIFWEYVSELWPGRHSRAMTLAHTSGVFRAIRTTLHLHTRPGAPLMSGAK